MPDEIVWLDESAPAPVCPEPVPREALLEAINAVYAAALRADPFDAHSAAEMRGFVLGRLARLKS